LKPQENSELKDILKKYYPEKELNALIKEISSESEFKGGMSVEGFNKIDLTDERIIIPENYLKIEKLITYSKNTLPKDKFFNLLFHLGGDSLSHGDYGLAAEVNQNIYENSKDDYKLVNLAAFALLSLADIHSRQAKWKESLSYARKAKNLFRKHNDKEGLGKSENLIGSIYAEQGKIKLANSHLEEALSHLNSNSNNLTVGLIENNLGILNEIMGNFEESLRYYQKAYTKFENSSEKRRMAEVKHNIGMLYLKQNKLKEALKEFDQSSKISFKSKFLPTLALTYSSKAHLYTEMDDLELSKAYAQKGMEICHHLNDKLTIADILKVYGIIARKEKDYSKAENFLMNSLRINEEHENNLNYAETSYELGLLYKDMGDKNRAESSFSEALSYHKKVGSNYEIEKINKLLEK
jgi:tetratricopeptide (TPR) repeat protein